MAGKRKPRVAVKGGTKASCTCGQQFDSIAQWKMHFLNNTTRGQRRFVNQGGTEEHGLVKLYKTKPKEEREPTQVECMCFISFNRKWDNTCCTLHKNKKARDPRTGIHPSDCLCIPCSEVNRVSNVQAK